MIKILDATNTFEKRGKPAIVSLDKEGKVSFSVEAVKTLDLKPGDKLAFAMDDDDKGIVYFFHSETGIPLREQRASSGATRLAIYCRPLATKLMAFFNLKDNKGFPVKSETTDFNGKKCWFIYKLNP